MVQAVAVAEFGPLAPLRIETTPSNDHRSYHVSSRKIFEKLGWKPKHTIEDAIRDLCRAFKAGKLRDSMTNDNYVNVRAIQRLGIR